MIREHLLQTQTKQKKAFAYEYISIPVELVADTNKAAVPLFRDTNIAVMR